jgi:hypothetical protein
LADCTAAAIKNPKRKSSEGFPAWTEDDAASYERYWLRGSQIAPRVAVVRHVVAAA